MSDIQKKVNLYKPLLFLISLHEIKISNFMSLYYNKIVYLFIYEAFRHSPSSGYNTYVKNCIKKVFGLCRLVDVVIGNAINSASQSK